MTYREMIERYKKGELNPEETERLERAIERQEAIGEYLVDREEKEAELFWKEEGETPKAGDGQKVMTDAIRRAIRRAFLKLGIFVGVAVFAVVMLLIFVVPKTVDLFFYDPGKQLGEFQNQMQTDLAVYSELALPGQIRDNVLVRDRGYGCYDIRVTQSYSLTGRIYDVIGRVERGSLTLYDPNILTRPTGNVFGWFQAEGTGSESLRELYAKEDNMLHGIAGGPQSSREALEGLDDDTLYLAYVTLDEMLPYEEFVKYLSSLDEDGLYAWCAVKTSDGHQLYEAEESRLFYPENLGFFCGVPSGIVKDGWVWDDGRYPELFLSWEEDTEEKLASEEAMSRHFTSLLRYTADQKDFLSMMENAPDAETLDMAADYVEENGLMVYGFAVAARKELLLTILEDPQVYEIYCTEDHK